MSLAQDVIDEIERRREDDVEINNMLQSYPVGLAHCDDDDDDKCDTCAIVIAPDYAYPDLEEVTV